MTSMVSSTCWRMEPGALVAVVTVLSNQEQPRVADLYREVARLRVMFSLFCALLAHQGGWDEILWVLLPHQRDGVAVAGGLAARATSGQENLRVG